ARSTAGSGLHRAGDGRVHACASRAERRSARPAARGKLRGSRRALRADPRRTLLYATGGGLVLLTLLGLHFQAGQDLDGLIVTTLIQGGVYLGAAFCVARGTWQGRLVPFILLIALLLRLGPLLAPPSLSTDIYRYVWDGRVQAAGINPYRYVPADPALAALRDAAVYPNINRAGYAR